MPVPSVESIQHDNAYLQDFKSTAYYEVWCKYLDLMVEDMTARLVNAPYDPLDLLRYYQGVLQGLSMARGVPDNVAHLAKTQP